jgi:hypothetical protein
VASARSLEGLEKALRRTPPVSTPFVEYRFTHLLKKPLRSSGTLEYRADGVLARHVETPYRETSEVAGEQVRIARAGAPARTLSLARSPQMRALLGSLRALLEGRLAPLESDFDITLEGQATQWTLSLRPRQAKLARQLERIDVFGRGDRPDCVETRETDGDGAFTLLSAPAYAALPASAAEVTRTELERLCRTGAAQLPATAQ